MARILGIKISRRGIEVPRAIKFLLVLGAILSDLVSSAVNAMKPSSDSTDLTCSINQVTYDPPSEMVCTTDMSQPDALKYCNFKTQKDVIDTLPKTCPSTTNEILNNLLAAKDPIGGLHSVPSNVQATVHTHQYINDILSHRITTKNADNSITEEEILHLGNNGKTITINRSNGRIVNVETGSAPISTHAAGLQKNDVRFTFSVDETTGGSCMNTRTPSMGTCSAKP